MVLLTPAEELGLSGLSLDSRVRKVFYGMPPERMVELFHQVHEEADRRNLVYMRHGERDVINVLLRPLAAMPDQMNYLNFVSLTILNALKRLPDLYLQDPRVREMLPLDEDAEAMLRDCWGPLERETNPVIGRLDAMADFTSPMWKDSLRFVEPNLCGIGGIYMGPTCDAVLTEIVLPALQEFDPSLQMEAGMDLRELFIQEILDHLENVGRGRQNVCLIEPKYADTGPVEQAAMARYFHDRHGVNVLHADPAELHMRNGEVWYEDQRVDVAYRDYEVRDFLSLEREQGVDITPIRTLFQQNRMVSTLAGDFDHKSCWELLTDPELTRKYFNAEERQVFRRHILWTRILADRRTSMPEGEPCDLLEFVRKERDILVIKPNRAYGGEGVIIGHLSEESEWDDAIQLALTGPDQWVVQRLASIPVNEFPIIGEDGQVHIEPFYTVMGFAPTKYGMGILGRASQKAVVNVAQRGGMCGVLVGRPAGGFIGPKRPARGT
ncbi:MAG: hypothetical protein AB7O62_03900 [Pirellulales bacterium]